MATENSTASNPFAIDREAAHALNPLISDTCASETLNTASNILNDFPVATRGNEVGDDVWNVLYATAAALEYEARQLMPKTAEPSPAS